MLSILNPILKNVLRYPFFRKSKAYYIVKLIVRGSIIINKSIKLFGNTVILENRKKYLKLSFGAIGED